VGSTTAAILKEVESLDYATICISFVHQVLNNTGSQNVLARGVFDSFVGFPTDMSYQAGTGVAPHAG
jgi:hypothetical protein